MRKEQALLGSTSGSFARVEHVRAAVHSSRSSRAGLALLSKLAQIFGQLTHLGSHPALEENKHLQKMAQNFAPVSFREAKYSEGKNYKQQRKELDIAFSQQEGTWCRLLHLGP